MVVGFEKDTAFHSNKNQDRRKKKKKKQEYIIDSIS